MMPSGYSDKPLVEKLGYKANELVFLMDASKEFKEYLNSFGVRTVRSLPADWAHIFCDNRAKLGDFLDSVDLSQISNGLWACWPKKSSGVDTDLTEKSFRDAILPIGWVDTKVAAIDDKWSGLKFVRRTNSRL